MNKQGRGLPFQYQLVYDSLVWTPVGSAGSQVWTPAVGWGLHGQYNEGYEGYISYDSATVACTSSGTLTYVPYYVGYVYHDASGVSHPLPYTAKYCYPYTFTGSGVPATDGSGYSYDGSKLTSADGRQIYAPSNSQTASGSITDTNGNVINNNGDGTFTDTLGKTALTITGSGTASSPRVFTYSTPTGTAVVTVAYKTYTVQTDFGCSNVTEYNLSQDLPNTITLGDGTVYTFGYEKTPNNGSAVTGRLISLTLPQGGVITYAYSGANNGIICADGTAAGLSRSIPGGSRAYARPAAKVTSTTSHTDVTDGLGNVTNFDFVMASSPESFYETTRTVNQTSPSSVLLTRQTCYGGTAPPCTTTAVGLPIAQIDTYEALNSEEHGSTLTYNTYGLQTSETDYDFGAATRGAVLRKETWTYPTSGIPSLLSVDTVTDGTSQIGLTRYLYDETSGTGHAALVTTSGLPQHGTESGQRGNLTTIQQYPNSGTNYLYTAAGYEDTGNALTVTAPSGVSSYAYDAATHAFTITATPPTPSSGVSLPSSATYDPNSGMPLTSVDPNSQTVTYKSYDPLLRPTEIDYPDGGKMVASYTYDQTGVYHYMTASTHTNTQTNLDGYGRLNWVAVQNASGGYYWNNYCYDGNGNLQFAAYRFTSGTIVCTGAGDTYTYDALGRKLKITHGDSSTVTYNYNGRATQVTDENGVSRIVQVDGLGRSTAVCEIVGTAQGGSACNLDITGTGFLTTYAYSTDTSKSNALKVAVTQGAQTRTFETDSLGRTISVVEPESGTTTYSYAYSATAGLGLTVTRVRPQANQTGSAQTTTTTQYDSVGRVVSVNYNDNLTPNKVFAYDTNTCWPQTPTNIKGRLAVTGGSSGATANGALYSYDVMGRVINIWACGPATCGTGYQASAR